MPSPRPYKVFGFLLHPEISERFPRQYTAVFGPMPSNTGALSPWEVIDIAQRECRNQRETWSAGPPRDVQHWREVYRQMGASPRYRSSVESLYERFLATGDLPMIHPVIDLYNWISLRHLVPMAGYDAEQIGGTLHLRSAMKGEIFAPLGNPAQVEKTKNGEVIYADEHDVICRYWNYRDSHKTRLRPDTKAVVFIADITAAAREGALALADAIRADLEAGLQTRLTYEVHP